LAREAYRLVPEQAAARSLHVITMLEAAAYEHGRDAPLDAGPDSPLAEAAKFDPTTLEGVLQEAIRDGHPAAATLIARLLGEKGTVDLLMGRHGDPTTLVLATRHADRRLRMAALEAIVRLAPVKPFPGDSYVSDGLAYFAASSGQRRMLSAAGQSDAARRTAGGLSALGYIVDTATTGRETVRMALASPDYEFAVIDTAIEEPTADMLIQELRRDCRAADLPVVLVARSGWLDRAEQLAAELPRVAAFPRPHNVEDLKWQVAQLMPTIARDFVPFAVRQKQAALALDLLARLSKAPEGMVDRRRVERSALSALHVPALSARAIPIIASLGTPECQRALVEVASLATEPFEVRKAAVLAFAQSTRDHGILLTGGEISRQYERYNQSQSQDRATQRILGLLLDSLEAQSVPRAAGKKPKPQSVPAGPTVAKPAS
jgi:CheY-like chemotaxis protein